MRRPAPVARWRHHRPHIHALRPTAAILQLASAASTPFPEATLPPDLHITRPEAMVYQVKDKSDFDAKLQEAGDKLVVVDFYATWCGPCKTISPKVEEMSISHADVVFLKVDVDECEEVAAQYGISCMPTFMFFKNGKKIEDFAGANEEMLKAKISELK